MKKKIKFVLVGLGSIVGLLVVGLLVTGMVMSQGLPEGEKGPKAEALADEMLEAVNIEAWNELKWLQWEFPGGHQYLWDKQRNLVEVKWGKNRVLLDPGTQTGKVYRKGEEVTGEEAEKCLKKAYHIFANDSFWLIAFTKVRDPGTERRYVELKDGGRGLLVTYTTGGVTPGDSYLWILDENGRPTAWRMWVKILPIGGLKSGWNDWQELYNGAMVAPVHKALVTLKIKNVKAGPDLSGFEVDGDPFSELN